MKTIVGNPSRVQLSRRKGWRMPPYTISVARPHRWGNPHRIGLCPVCGVEHTRAEAVAELRAEFAGNPTLHAQAQAQLRGKNLACWCKPSEACHADVLLDIANIALSVKTDSKEKQNE